MCVDLGGRRIIKKKKLIFFFFFFFFFLFFFVFFFFKQKTAYEIHSGDWSSDVCSSDLWFVLGGVAIGMLVENNFVSPSIVALFVKIIRIWLKILKKFLHIFGKPLKKIHLFFRKELKKIRKAIKIGLSKD